MSHAQNDFSRGIIYGSGSVMGSHIIGYRVHIINFHHMWILLVGLSIAKKNKERQGILDSEG